jgi:hypothetical protein
LLVRDVFYECQYSGIQYRVKGKNLSSDSDTSLLDFAESRGYIVEQVAGGRGRLYRLLGFCQLEAGQAAWKNTCPN